MFFYAHKLSTFFLRCVLLYVTYRSMPKNTSCIIHFYSRNMHILRYANSEMFLTWVMMKRISYMTSWCTKITGNQEACRRLFNIFILNHKFLSRNSAFFCTSISIVQNMARIYRASPFKKSRGNKLILPQ